MTVSSGSPQALSHGWITRTDVGLYHTSGSSARQVPRPSPAIACGKLPTKQLPNSNTQETTVFHLQALWSHVMMEKEASGDVPAQWHTAHARAGARQKSSLPYQNCSSQKYSLQLAPVHRTPHLPDAEACRSPYSLSFYQRYLGEVPPPLQSHRKSNEHHTLINYLGGKSWKNIYIVASPNQTLQFEVWVKPWIFIHIFVLIQKWDLQLTGGLHWNCQSL